MPKRKSPRKGSLQFWPRKRAKKFLPRVNWGAIDSDSKNLKGFICYKTCMATALLKDNTPNSMTRGKNISLPVTILECPPLRIFSVRFYKDGGVVKEILAEGLERELKRKIKVPKKYSKKIGGIDAGEYDDIRVIVYSQIKKTGVKKKPDLAEIGLYGNPEEKLNFAGENLGRDISVLDVFSKGQLIDIRGLTKGKGFQGPVKRFGIVLRAHKSEKGVRKAGCLGPWHPARVTFRAPMAGQLGMFTRVSYNSKIIDVGKISDGNKEEFRNLKNYGDIKTDYAIVSGSVQGSSRRQLLITAALRQSKKTKKKNYEFERILR